ncbi:hypothetical protein EDI_327450 [Entamoeba dispar SAW760]|uniref:Phage tail lysozyme domain-containing protein n=1 Tax=Entamoeba dispar (strain ATCC PRA-260 / SAW760) TaxID=370354 RepID=B0EEY1_ENTDS|nr:uncharacterized protein EDI_327450 [Entamoeba dispar SAW760]EDR26917.1 hypothetical protein EDI_327450 [Entamoeba dispar SAW760]|eukprot:EDR26917.1 hypothetical protein EDI_327450 [Entamoeba dispar SAW760]
MTSYTLNKGSCGFGSVQWSFKRRVSFAKVCLEVMTKDSDVNDNNWAIAESKFISKELKDSYYNKVANAAKKAGSTVEAWAEAFTDYYERPAGSDRNMSAEGNECKKRRGIARSIYDHLKSQNAF